MIKRFAPVVVSALLLAGCFSQAPAPTVDRSATPVARSAPPVQSSGPGYYTVKRGDNLFRIGLDVGQDYRDIAAWNGIALPESLIREGQVLRVVPPVQSPDNGGTTTKPVAVAPVVESRSLDAPVATVSSTPSNLGNLKREPRVGKLPYSDEAHARMNHQGETPPPKVPEVKASDGRPEMPPAISSASTVDEVVWVWPSSGKVLAMFGEGGGKGIDIAGKMGDAVSAAADGKVIYVGEAIPQLGKLIIIKHSEVLNTVYAHNSKFLVKETDMVKRGQKIAEMGKSGAEQVKLHFEIRKQGKPVDPAQYLPKR